MLPYCIEGHANLMHNIIAQHCRKMKVEIKLLPRWRGLGNDNVIAVFWQNVNFQVTTSCTSVYVDGSESRGALAAEIDIKYGAPQYMGRAVFTVWMPETPLNINVADTRLSQIKGWKVPQHHYFQQGEQGTPSSQQQDPSSHNRGKQNQTAAFHNEVPTANTREQCKYVNWIFFCHILNWLSGLSIWRWYTTMWLYHLWRSIFF